MENYIFIVSVVAAVVCSLSGILAAFCSRVNGKEYWITANILFWIIVVIGIAMMTCVNAIYIAIYMPLLMITRNNIRNSAYIDKKEK